MKRAPGASPLERALGWFLVVVMAVSVANVLWQVFTRFVLSSPSSYTEELARYLLVWIGLVGAAYASGQRLHVAIDLLRERLSGRRRVALGVVVECCVATFAVGVLVVGGLRLTVVTVSLGQTSAALGVSLAWVYAALPVSGLLIAWFSFTRMWRLLKGTTDA